MWLDEPSCGTCQKDAREDWRHGRKGIWFHDDRAGVEQERDRRIPTVWVEGECGEKCVRLWESLLENKKEIKTSCQIKFYWWLL